MRWALPLMAIASCSAIQPDITDSLQAQLDYAGSANPTNVIVNIPPGDYHISQTLSLPTVGFPNNGLLGVHDGVRISGSGMSQTKLIWDAPGSIGLALTGMYGYEGVTVENLALVGPGDSSSIGLAIGASTSVCFSGRNNRVHDVALLNWGYGACITNQWGIVFDNCIIASNSVEGIRFVGTHGASVQNCNVRGGWSTAGGIGIGFHPPPNRCYGDNGQVVNTFVSNYTNGIWNNELNLTCLNDHLEACGSCYSLYTLAGQTTILGGYTLDLNYLYPWTNGFSAQIQCDSSAARNLVIENVSLTSGVKPRYIFAVQPDPSAYAVPTYIGPGKLSGLYGGSSVTVYPLGTHHRFWNKPVASALKVVQ